MPQKEREESKAECEQKRGETEVWWGGGREDNKVALDVSKRICLRKAQKLSQNVVADSRGMSTGSGWKSGGTQGKGRHRGGAKC